MKIIDFIYFISYKVYLKGNKEEHGSFLINSLWISSHQTMLFYILLSLVEISVEIKLFPNKPESSYLLIFGPIFIVINNIYLYTGNRKKRIINGFNISTKKAIIYWIIYSISFFVFFFLSGYMSYLKKEIFSL